MVQHYQYLDSNVCTAASEDLIGLKHCRSNTKWKLNYMYAQICLFCVAYIILIAFIGIKRIFFANESNEIVNCMPTEANYTVRFDDESKPASSTSYMHDGHKNTP